MTGELRDVPYEVKRLVVALIHQDDHVGDVERVVRDVAAVYAEMPGLADSFERVERQICLPVGNRALQARYRLILAAIAAGCDPDVWRHDEVVADLADIEASVSLEMRAALDALDHAAQARRNAR